MKKLFLFILVSWSFNMIAAKQDFTVGYFPATLPRDPIEIDIFLEHIAIGQVIETLIKIDSEGNLIPNIAKSWVIKDEGKSFIFQINENIVFSTGKKLDCSDIKFSILRHKDSAGSQSKNYLKNISEINCLNNLEIEFKLNEPQVSFLKILTRDHLGILPTGWKFDRDSLEPWTGTGAYRFVQGKGKSQFVKNEKYRRANEVKVARWNILKTDNIIENFNNLIVPDLVLHIPAHVKNVLEQNPKFKEVEFQKPMHFIQASAWWYPLGTRAKDEKLKGNMMSIMDKLVLKLNKDNKFELATGVVPKGIQGHITKRLEAPKPPRKFDEFQTIKVTVYGNDFDAFFGSDTYKALEAEYNFKFQVSKYNFVENDPKIIRPDILIASYAGGFSDPDGFLIVLGSLLGVEPGVYLKDVSNIYREASKEQDWTVRGDMFRKINESLITQQQVVPAWKRDMYIGKSTRLVDDTSLFSYSLRIERFTPK